MNDSPSFFDIGKHDIALQEQLAQLAKEEQQIRLQQPIIHVYLSAIIGALIFCATVFIIFPPATFLATIFGAIFGYGVFQFWSTITPAQRQAKSSLQRIKAARLAIGEQRKRNLDQTKSTADKPETGVSTLYNPTKWVIALLLTLFPAYYILVCCGDTRQVKHQTGTVQRISGGILTTNKVETAFFVLQTTCGTFAFTSDDIRKPQEIVKDVHSSVDAIVPGGHGGVTIHIYNCASTDWTVYHSQRQVFLPNGGGCWIRSFFEPCSNISYSFARDVTIPFVFDEKTQRSTKTTASGP